MTPITTCQQGPSLPTSQPTRSLSSFIFTPSFYCWERWRDGGSKESDSLPFMNIKMHATLCNFTALRPQTCYRNVPRLSSEISADYVVEFMIKSCIEAVKETMFDRFRRRLFLSRSRKLLHGNQHRGEWEWRIQIKDILRSPDQPLHWSPGTGCVLAQTEDLPSSFSPASVGWDNN